MVLLINKYSISNIDILFLIDTNIGFYFLFLLILTFIYSIIIYLLLLYDFYSLIDFLINFSFTFISDTINLLRILLFYSSRYT